MSKIKTVRLANGRSFPTRWQASGWWVGDIHKKGKDGRETIVLTFKRGAETIRRTFAKRYVELVEG